MRKTVIVYLALLALVDVVIPVPLLALLLIWVAVNRPPWFTEMVGKVYEEEPRGGEG